MSQRAHYTFFVTFTLILFSCYYISPKIDMKRSVHILKIQIDLKCLGLICEKSCGLYSPLELFSKYAVNHKVDAAIEGHLKYFGF